MPGWFRQSYLVRLTLPDLPLFRLLLRPSIYHFLFPTEIRRARRSFYPRTATPTRERRFLFTVLGIARLITRGRQIVDPLPN